MPDLLRSRVLVAVGAWLVGTVLLVVAAWAAARDPALDLVVPATGAVSWWAVAGCLVVQACVLGALWPRGPLALVAVSTLAPVAALLGGGDATGSTSVAVIVAAFLASSRSGLRAAAPWLLVAGVMVAIATAVSTSAGSAAGLALAGLLQAVGTLVGPVLVGVLVRSGREARAARVSEALALQREHDALVREAIARERSMIARELHDVAAHHLTGITVMSAAIDRQITADPEGARAAVAEVRTQSKALLNDLRRLVGLLRDGADATALPGSELADVGALVTTLRATGADVTLTVHGTGWQQAPGPLASRSAYRTVQEALTNAARHAPGAPCEVVVDASAPDHLVVEVSNGAPAAPGDGPGSGLGLVGMQERAELLGGRIESGPTPTGGWRVALSLPLEVAG